MGVFTLTLVRHGETRANKEGVIQGQQDTELSERGLQQAYLAGIRLQQEHFTHVYTSDLKRAYTTCELILEKNSTSSGHPSVVKDPKLRERKFGIFEGRPSIEFQTAAKKFRKSSVQTEEFPPGGETVKQLKARAREFFKELCERLCELETEGGSLAATKRRKHTGSTCSDVFPTEGTTADPSAQTSELSLKIKHHSTSSIDSKLSPTAAKDSGHSSSGSTSSTSGCESLTAGSSLEHLVEYRPLPPLCRPDEVNLPTTSNQDFPTSDISPSSQESSSSSLDDGEPVVGMVFDTEVHSIPCHQKSMQYGCPNVSLSPIFEHRLTSMSSISSGRNNSFDDSDSLPVTLAEVLVVSHGGWIQQLLNIFVEEYSCKIPGGKKYALQVSPNTGLSKFTCTLDPGTDTPSITCLYIHDKDHLVGLEAGLCATNPM